MWMLLLLLSISPGHLDVKVIQAYTSQAECEEMRGIIDKNFHDVYKGDDHFAAVCIKEKQIEA